MPISFRQRISMRVDIQGYEGKYQVDTNGAVYSVKRKGKGSARTGGQLAYIVLNSGYASVSLSSNNTKKRFLVHRLVATSFIPNIDNKPQVNHIDGNKLNNSVSNLEWTTQSENMTHAVKLGLTHVSDLQYKKICERATSEKNKAHMRALGTANAKITKDDAKIMATLRKGGWTFMRIADRFKVSHSVVIYNIKKLKEGRFD